MTSEKPILLIEDDRVDAMTVKRALKEIEVGNELIVVGNGEEAISWLQQNSKSPCIMLLDLNMPKMNGHEFLSVVKNDDNFKCIPVVVLTTSRDDYDKTESFKKSVAGYMIKPVDYSEFVRLMKTLDAYWTASELPNN